MKVTTKQMREVNVVTDVICDICGKSCLDEMGMNFEFAHLEVCWGYGSQKDCERHEIDICEDCYDQLPFVKEGKVRIYDYTEGDEPLNEAAKRAARK